MEIKPFSTDVSTGDKEIPETLMKNPNEIKDIADEEKPEEGDADNEKSI